MAIIYQPSLFSWKIIDDLGDIERLQTVLENLPDEELMRILEKKRGHGRNDYPIRPIWNAYIAGIVFQHSSLEQLIRELRRNAQLREFCGFDPLNGAAAVPTSAAFSRFYNTLMQEEELVREIFDKLVKALEENLEGFGKNLAFDGKIIPSAAKGKKRSDIRTDDRRREEDADWTMKTYWVEKSDGSVEEKKKSMFGYRVHLIVDADHEIPVAFKLTPASKGEQPVMRGLFKELAEKHPKVVENCEHGMGDRGYDGEELIEQLWKEYEIKPIIDIRNMWKEKETRLLKGKDLFNVSYDYKGEVYCHCPKNGEIRKMAYNGFERDRGTQKFACPAVRYGVECEGKGECCVKQGLRVGLEENPRIFTPVARGSYKWERLYRKRTSVERVNSRIDGSFGFSKHYIRGLRKMRVRCGISMSVMLSLALGRVRQGRKDLMRKLLEAA